MERFCQGEAAAFDALFERYAGPLRRFAWRLVGSQALADDITQATFLSLVRARGRFRAGAQLRPWLYAIATNAARDQLRNARAREQLTSTGGIHPVASESPLEASDLGLERAVHRAIGQLPEGIRLAVVMHRFEGMSFAEIAGALETTEGAVKVRAHRGYVRLRELLRDVWEELA